MRRTILLIIIVSLATGCSPSVQPPRGESADPAGQVGPPRTPFIERTLERARPD